MELNISNLRVKTKKEMIRDFGLPESDHDGNKFWRIPGKGITFVEPMFKHLGKPIPISEYLYLLMLGIKDSVVLFKKEEDDIQSWHFAMDMITNI